MKFWLKKQLASLLIRRSLKERELSPEELESKHKNPNVPLFNDSSYFLGRSEDGSYMVVRQAFRTTRGHEYWLNIFLPGKGSFELKGMNATEGEGFRLGNLKFDCLEPGKTWEISYNGPIHCGNEVHEIEIKWIFTGIQPLINFKNITNPSVTAAVIAAEKWDGAFFRKLKEIKKVHLEQGGNITGTIKLDGEEINIDWRSVRDHSWGSRSWGKWKRHVWLSGVLDNNEVFNVSMISYDFLGQLGAGYITANEHISYLNQTPDMNSFAGDPLIPEKGKFTFFTQDGKQHELGFEMAGRFEFMMDNEYYIYEGMGNFILDGIKGMGVAEFGLNPEFYDLKTR